MKKTRSILSRVVDILRTQPAPAPRRVLIANTTRHTVLASRVEVADTSESRRKGLLGRTGLDREEGMWILPCESVHTFAMRFPIDIVYIDKQHRVRKVKQNVPPWRLSACFSAHSVVELASGTIRDSRTEPGDLLKIESSAVL
jgi:uncharacterized membrane protein (UPF0127 family)